MFLDIMDETTVPHQGTSIGDAIHLALKNFPVDEKTGRAIVLLTDGEDHHSDPVGAAQEAKEKGVVILTIGIGTPKGDVIKERDAQGKVTSFHKYKGEIVVSALDDALLGKIAAITGGHYYRASSTDAEIDEIANIINGFEKKEFATKLFERLEERYQIFALIGLLLLIIEFFYGETPGQWRRVKNWVWNHPRVVQMVGKSAALVLILFFFQPLRLFADIKSHVRQGNRLLKKGDIAGARAEFESAEIDAPEAAFLPYNIGATYYLEGKFEEAQKQYEKAEQMATSPGLKSMIAYNLGHLLYTEGKPDQAIEKFEECLKLNPKDFDAKYNIEYIKSGKKPKQPFQPQPQPNQDQSKGGGPDRQSGQGQEGGKNKSQAGEQKKEEGVSKEDAERILQMIQDQEKEKLKQSKPVRVGNGEEKKKEEDTGEDW
jgi:Ca-activated chloride channel family protein